MPTARERKQEKKSEAKSIEDRKWEEKKLRVEWIKAIATVFAPVIAAFVAALVALTSINKQLSTQNDLKDKEIESELLLRALSEPNDSLLHKLIYTGFLDDSKKRYSFLLYDTIIVKKPRLIGFGDTSKTQFKDISKWDTGHVKNPCGCIEAYHFQSLIYTNGMIKFSFDVESQRALDEMSPVLRFKNEKDKILATISLPPIAVPAYKMDTAKRIIFEAHDEAIKKNYNNIMYVSTDWKNCK